MSNNTLFLLIIAGIIPTALILIHATAKTYYMKVDTLRTLLTETTHSMVEVSMPTLGTHSTSRQRHMANTISTIPCFDKRGQQYTIQNTPKVEVQLTINGKKRIVLYFDTLILKDGYITGSRSRIISGLSKSIPISDITKIELQKGRKQFNYTNRQL